MASIENKIVFARNLRRFIESRGLQDKDLCEIAGASQTAISEWLNAKKYPRIDKIERLANFFGVPKSSLIEDETEAGRKEIERQATAIIHSLPDKYKLVAVDYLRYIATKAKDEDSQSTVPL